MKKFSITQLETARANPKDFAKMLEKEDQSSTGFGYPKSMRWLNAVNRYHETLNISDAFTSIEEGLSKRKDSSKNRRELEKLIEALANYETSLIAQEYQLIKSRESINLNLTSSLIISGQIPLVYMKPEGFAAYFISKENFHWRDELKYPILQNHLAQKVFSINPNDIEIGYIDFMTGDFFKSCFTEEQIQDAEGELKKISLEITKFLKTT